MSIGRQLQVDAVLDRFFSLAKNRAKAFGAEYVKLWEALECNTSGGKRFRPRMVMAAYEGLGGTDIHAAAYVGAAFELLHTALIVHDDVIDRDFSRRGIPNVSGSYRDIATTAGIPIPTAEHRGMSVAIIAGDLALFNSYRLIDRSGVTGEVREHLLEILDYALFASAAGELIDVDLSLTAGLPGVDEVLTMERLKTAVYTFESPLQAGAVLAGAPDVVVAALASYGREVGIAYQIVDDLLGVFGLETETGKTTLGDLREGKRTVLIAHATQTPEWSVIYPYIGKSDLSERDATLVRTALEVSGSRSFTERLARSHVDRALASLAHPEIPEPLRAELSAVAFDVLSRVR
ncbi:MAG: polyprenyl synthetase family protein [Microbacteriaceae bacterium]|nr:polyprenyl synthetase family protein [Microbacteriaceae bacterium]